MKIQQPVYTTIATAALLHSATAAPSVESIRTATPDPDSFVETPRVSPAAHFPGFAAADTIYITITLDQPVVAFRTATATSGVVGFDEASLPTDSLAFTVRGATPDDLFVLDLIDAVSSTGINPRIRALVAPFPGDYALGPENARDFRDVIAFLSLFDEGGIGADHDRNGTQDSGDIVAMLGSISDAEPTSPLAPIVSDLPAVFVPSGSLGRPAEFTIGDAFVPVEELSVSVVVPDGGVIDQDDVFIERSGDSIRVFITTDEAAEGSASVRVVVSNGAASTSQLMNVEVRRDEPPIARFRSDAFVGVAPLRVEFDASPSSDALDNIRSYEWDFGDGSAADGPSATHVFESPGEYTVRCVVTDDSGLFDTAQRVITVAAAPFDLNTRGGPDQITREEAARFLWQAAFGPTPGEIDDVIALGYEGWIRDQFDTPTLLRRPPGPDVEVIDIGPYYNTAPDQLRQRMAWALVQTITLGESGNDQAVAYTYDMYIRHAFGHPSTSVEPAVTGNYRELLAEVTTNRPMGEWLTYLGNRKANPETRTEPDENYARELMQLFSIGLWELTPDGRRVQNVFGDDIPTYDMEDVRQFARVFTGYFSQSVEGVPGAADAMYMNQWHHEFGDKQLIDYPGAVPPDGYIPSRDRDPRNGLLDVEEALDNVFYHPSCPPFIAELLIKRFTTSNPSRAYVGRVADAFRGSGPYGSGIRGDLKATILAILLDDEARNPVYAGNEFAGKIIEPFVYMIAAGRILGHTDPGVRSNRRLQELVGQAHYRTPSVFNFYKPEFTPQSTDLSRAGLTAPELQIYTESQAIGLTEAIDRELLRESNRTDRWDPDLVAELIPLGEADPAALVDRVHELFRLNASEAALDTIRTALENVPAGERNGRQRVNVAVYLYLLNPEARVLR